MFCPNCGKQQPDDANFCMECGRRVAGTPVAALATHETPAQAWAKAGEDSLFSDSERSEVLEHRIQEFTAVGFMVVSRTAFGAQFARPRRGLGKQATIYLSVSETGHTEIVHPNRQREILPPPRRRR